jgi:prepilin-type processing-associated H-X9-DG protein
MLDYIEQSARSDLYNDNVAWHNQAEAERGRIFAYLPVWSCPSDRSYEMANAVYDDYKGNYGLNWGQYSYYDQVKETPFFFGYGARMADITDGTSNTMAMMEMLQAPSEEGSPKDRRGQIWNEDYLCYAISTRFTPNTTAPDLGVTNACADQPQIGLPCTLGTASADLSMASRSRHPGGVQVLLCDGSVRFVSETLALTVWQAASSQNNREPEMLP